MSGNKTLQWIGKGVLPNLKNRKDTPFKYGDVLPGDVLKAMGQKRVDQLKDKGKIGQVPMPSGPGASDDVIRLKDALLKLQSGHDGVLSINKDLSKQVEDLEVKVDDLNTENGKITKEKANADLSEEIDKLKSQIAELTNE